MKICACTGESLLWCFLGGGKTKVCLCLCEWWPQYAAYLGFDLSADAVRRAQCIVGKENL